MTNSTDLIRSSIAAHQTLLSQIAPLIPSIEQVGQRLNACLKNGGKILLMGNGGSAADSQHIAAEIVVRYQTERRGLAAIALTTDTSILTAAGNDFGFEQIYSRQVEALCSERDAVVGISTSGNSVNIIRAIATARELGATTIGMTGVGGGKLAAHCDFLLAVPSPVTARVQEMHILIGHILCELVDHAHTTA
ncbi:MAG: D-sedoheptulose 7-phosphate isomerase [Methylophilales bacterium]|nr:D-sedoheptulose 7-phosphate isomerase [Methylophilales bacterium]